MKTYRVEATVTVEVVTMVQAESEQEAERIAADKEVGLCIHGSEFADGFECISGEDFVLKDGSWDNLELGEIEEVNVDDEEEED